jgi:hypothetical protein
LSDYRVELNSPLTGLLACGCKALFENLDTVFGLWSLALDSLFYQLPPALAGGSGQHQESALAKYLKPLNALFV